MPTKDLILRTATAVAKGPHRVRAAAALKSGAPADVLVEGTPFFREEISRRVREVVEGQARTVDGFQMIDRMRRKLTRKNPRRTVRSR